MAKVYKRESQDQQHRWMHYLVIEDECVTVVDLRPALLAGWNFDRYTRQGADDWPGMSAEQIIEWKAATGQTLEPVDDASAARTILWLREQGVQS